MITLHEELAEVERTPIIEEAACEPDAADWAWHCAATRPTAPDPPAALTTDAAGWVEVMAAWQHAQADDCDPLGAYGLCAAVLDRLVRSLRGQHAAGLLAYGPGWLDVPDPHAYATRLGLAIAAEAALLYPYDSALVRLTARRLLGLAAEVERLGAEDAQEYLMLEAAERAALVDLMCEGVYF